MTKSWPSPPQLAVRLFEWYCNDAMVEDLTGDMDELFYHNIKTMPAWKARLKYWLQVFNLLGSYALRKRKADTSFHVLSNTQITTTMFNNYFKVAYRSLLKHKFFTFTNIVGLSIGMSISLLLLAVIADVYDYDQFQVNKDYIYRITTKTYDRNKVEEYATSPAPAADLVAELPGIKKVVRMNNTLSGEVNYQDKYIPMSGFFVDPAFLEVFSFKLLKGNPKTALANPSNLLITQKEAKKLFSDANPLGKTVTIDPLGDFVITGVFENPPKKSHIQFGIIGAFNKVRQLENQQAIARQSGKWDHLNTYYTYLQLKKDASPETIASGLEKISESKQASVPDLDIKLQLQAMSDITFGKELNRSLGPQWDFVSMLIFAVMALLILVPACFNYASISIARALNRAKEIGIRKVVGGQKKQVFFQFIVETMLVCFLSFLFAYVIFTFLRSEFLSILAPASSAGLTLQLSPTMVILFISFTLLTGFLIGIMPAMHFSNIKPLQALKSKLPTRASGKFNARKVLLVVQFTVSLGFIMAVVIMINQYRYSINYKLGFEKENILNVALRDADYKQWETEVSKMPEITNISFSSDIIGALANNYTWLKQVGEEDSTMAYQEFVDQRYLNIHKIPLVAGNNFPEDITHDEAFILVNEAFVAKMGYTNPIEALNKSFALQNGAIVSIIGVVKDFNYAELREKIRPFIFRYDPKKFAYANLEVATNDIFSTLTTLEDKWEKFSERKFKAEFLTTTVDDAYHWYFNFLKMTGFLGLLAITISCLGLLGMVVFNVQNRTKEVGIRKVHGATSQLIVMLLSKTYLKLMVISAFIAVPVTYWLFDALLPHIQHYHASIGAGTIIISVLIMFLIGSVTVASQTLKAAKTNPADTLRHE